jgi:NADH:ubiquinone oxidoreductase subunit B-like Fe-S oxidoreductase
VNSTDDEDPGACEELSFGVCNLSTFRDRSLFIVQGGIEEKLGGPLIFLWDTMYFLVSQY